MYLEYVLFMKRMATVCASELHKETTVKKAQAITADLIRKVGPVRSKSVCATVRFVACCSVALSAVCRPILPLGLLASSFVPLSCRFHSLCFVDVSLECSPLNEGLE